MSRLVRLLGRGQVLRGLRLLAGQLIPSGSLGVALPKKPLDLLGRKAPSQLALLVDGLSQRSQFAAAVFQLSL